MINKIKYMPLLCCLLVFSLNAGTLEQEAFKAYRKGDYKKAFLMYKKVAKEKRSLKSLLMLGIFFEKGLGVKKDVDKAIRLYKLVIKKSKKNVTKSNRALKISIIAAKRLYRLTGNKSYKILAEKLNKFKVAKSKVKSKTPKVTDKKDDNINLAIQDYYVMCPAAKRVPLEYAQGITEIDCNLFKNFPDRMVDFMKLKKRREDAIAKGNKALAIRVEKQINNIVKPIVKYLQQETIECYNGAKLNSDIKACDYDYLSKTDPLFFTNAAYEMERKIANKEYKDYKLDYFDKEDLINSLIFKFSNNSFRKKSSSYGDGATIVQIY